MTNFSHSFDLILLQVVREDSPEGSSVATSVSPARIPLLYTCTPLPFMLKEQILLLGSAVKCSP